MAWAPASLLTLLAVLAAGVRAGWHYTPPRALDAMLLVPIAAFFGLFAWRAVTAAKTRAERGDAWRHRFADVLVAAALCAALFVVRPLDAVIVMGHALLLVRAALTWPEWSARVSGLRFRPALLVTGSFAALVLVGTALLLLPVSVSGPVLCRPVDALFTATSAACVTGLIVVDTGTFWSPFGHAVILVLIEAGGLGIMTLWAGMLILAGRHLGMRESVALGGILESDAPRVLRRTIRRIVLWTVAVQTAGTLLLLPAFLEERGSVWSGVGYAAFHAVSAFCNAGFALYGDSLSRFGTHLLPMGVVMTLIVIGGLGFPVLDEIWARAVRAARRRTRMAWSFHARIVVVTSLCLTSFATLAIFFLEFDGTLGAFGIGHRMLAALFQSVTLRTAGFNTIDVASLAPATLVVMIAMMLIGAAPASTGGGVKVSTIGVLVLTVRSFVRKRSEVEAFGWRVPPVVVQKAIGIAVAFLMLVFAGMLVLTYTESAAFESLLFETVSALGTVGLSTGVTGSLTETGRLTIIALMFLGRVGPLTLALAVGRRARTARYRYPEGRVLVG